MPVPAVRAAQDLAVDDDAAADARANSEHHAKTRPAQGASRILTECTALTVVIDGNRHPQCLAHELSQRAAVHKRERTAAMDRSRDVSLVDTAGRTHTYGAHALTVRLDKPDQRRNRPLSRGKARRQAPALADGKILAQHSPFNGRTAHIDSKELLHIRSSRTIAPDAHRREHHRGCPL